MNFFKKFLFIRFFCWLGWAGLGWLGWLGWANWLMLSDKHNSIMGKARSLISLLVTSSGDVPFCQLQQLQCLHHGSTKAYLCFSFFIYCHVGDDLRYTGYGFGIRLGLVQS